MAAGEYTVNRTARCLWLAMYLQRFQRVRFEDYRLAFGMAMRTYRRDLATLRAAGLILDGNTNNMGLRYITFDESLARTVA